MTEIRSPRDRYDSYDRQARSCRVVFWAAAHPSIHTYSFVRAVFVRYRNQALVSGEREGQRETVIWSLCMSGSRVAKHSVRAFGQLSLQASGA